MDRADKAYPARKPRNGVIDSRAVSPGRGIRLRSRIHAVKPVDQRAVIHPPAAASFPDRHQFDEADVQGQFGCHSDQRKERALVAAWNEDRVYFCADARFYGCPDRAKDLRQAVSARDLYVFFPVRCIKGNIDGVQSRFHKRRQLLFQKDPVRCHCHLFGQGEFLQ